MRARGKSRPSRSSGSSSGNVGPPTRGVPYPATVLTCGEQGLLASAFLDKDKLLSQSAFVFVGYGLADAIEPIALDTAIHAFSGDRLCQIYRLDVPEHGLWQAPADLGSILEVWPYKYFLGPHAVENETNTTLVRIAQTATQEYEDETSPPRAVIEELTRLISEAVKLMATSMTEGVVSTFYGEINVTWRNVNDIVRLACFPNRPSILQFGSLSQPLGSYQSQPTPSALDLARRLDALAGEVA